MRRNAWLELDGEVLCANVRMLRDSVSADTQLVMVVKANAYGHGMTAVARRALALGVRWFMVSRMDEAVELRGALPDAHILLMGSVWAGDLEEVMAHRIRPVLVSEDQAAALAAEARRRGVVLGCHVKVDTGMGRFGFAWQEVVPAMVRLRAAGGLAFEGIATHFASAGHPGDRFAILQEERFRQALAECERHGFTRLFRHVSNSGAFSAHPSWDQDGVRLGIIVYGYGQPRREDTPAPRPFLQWKTRVVQVKPVPAGFPVSYLSTHVTEAPTRLATVDVGYSDGFSRLMSNTGCVLVGGRRAPVVGRVTMNFIVVDIGSQGGVYPGDEVVLIGRQGDEAIWADEVARWCQTIPYEILTSIRSDRHVWRE